MTPLVLLVGFLGSGKTSVLRRLLPLLRGAGVRTHVLLNDYVNAELDGATLAGKCDDLRLVTGGCVCCDSEQAVLRELASCEVGDRDAVLFEVNGTADPLLLIETLLLRRASQRFRPLLQVTVVDVLRWQQRGENNDLERLQVRTATHIVLSWENKADPDRTQRVRQAVHDINPLATVTTAIELAGELVECLYGSGCCGSVLVARADRPSSRASVWASPQHDHQLAHRFEARQVEIPRRISRAQFTGWLDSLPTGVLRAKGIVEFDDTPHQYHYFNRVATRLFLAEYPARPPQNRTLGLLIGMAGSLANVATPIAASGA